LLRGERRRELDHGQGIAACPLDETIPDARCEGRHPAVEEFGGGVGLQPADGEFNEAASSQVGTDAVLARDEDSHRFDLETACREHDRVGGRFVQPLGVVDQDEHRLLLGEVGK